jgi:hypothetical protein
MLTASSAAADHLRELLTPALQQLGLPPSVVNILPIAPPFANAAGLHTHANYLMLLARNILEPHQLPRFKNYIAGTRCCCCSSAATIQPSTQPNGHSTARQNNRQPICS